MDQQTNAICQVCGAPYKICHVCTSVNSWRVAACSTQHYQIRMIYLQFRDGLISEDAAKEMLARVGELDYSGYTAGYKAFFEKLYEPPVVGIDDVDVVEEEPVVTAVKRRRTKKTVVEDEAPEGDTDPDFM